MTSTYKTNMDFSFPIIALLLHFLLLFPLVCPVYSSETSSHQLANQTFRKVEEIHNLKKTIRNHLQSINKPHVKTIQSSDGDIMDCVVSHKQPAFDHSLLKGQKPMDPPKRPRGNNQMDILNDNFQLWNLSSESCPKGTIPIRRTKEEDILRAGSIERFERKSNQFRRDTLGNGHEYSVAFVTGDGYYGAQATLNVWAPYVENQDKFSLAQIWVTSGSPKDRNTIEAGWQVNPSLYGDNRPRLFVYWTADGYNQTGCYNLLCPGFVQTSNKIVVGGAITPISTYNGGQFDITLLIFKDPKYGNWWLEYSVGYQQDSIGYWPSSLFTTLKDKSTKVQFGGEIMTTISTGAHTSTQMGSGHFAEEGFGKASYFRNMQVVGSKNYLIPLSNQTFIANRPNCYNITGGINDKWGNYFYYGGPGKNMKCP